MKRIVLAVLVLAFAAGPVLAQNDDVDHEPMKQIDQARKRENAAIDKQYQRTLKATRGDAPAPLKADPWAKMRGSDTASQKK